MGWVTPILPVAGEKQPDNITKFFFDALLQFIISEVYIRVKNKMQCVLTGKGIEVLKTLFNVHKSLI